MSERSIKALLFSDVKGFSKMSERECYHFCSHFHGGVQREVLSRFEDKIVLKNTWGDALHIVLDDVVAAGYLALALRDWVQSFPWTECGLSEHLQIRIGLHVGVVTQVVDPIIQAFNYIGRNTSKAARIEPITYEGQVFVSQAYAAILATQSNHTLVCDYVGMRELPKEGGEIPVYILNC